MTGFLGEYEATLDSKGRFLLPVGFKNSFRKTAPPNSSSIVVLKNA